MNIPRLLIRGNIVRVYDKMYNLAESLAIHEMNQRDRLLLDKANKKVKDPHKYLITFAKEMTNYKEKRIEYHMNKMKELLKFREELIEEKTNQSSLEIS